MATKTHRNAQGMDHMGKVKSRVPELLASGAFSSAQ